MSSSLYASVVRTRSNTVDRFIFRLNGYQFNRQFNHQFERSDRVEPWPEVVSDSSSGPALTTLFYLSILLLPSSICDSCGLYIVLTFNNDSLMSCLSIFHFKNVAFLSRLGLILFALTIISTFNVIKKKTNWRGRLVRIVKKHEDSSIKIDWKPLIYHCMSNYMKKSFTLS